MLFANTLSLQNKTKYIQKAAQILLDQYNSDIPGSLDELIKLPGVGPKMAHICMHSAWNVVTGIGETKMTSHGITIIELLQIELQA